MYTRRAAPVKLVAKQDTADSEHLRLKPYQVSALIQAPGIANLRGLRDTALMTLMVCTGIRAAEAAALQVDDLRQHLGGELSLRVREGKGAKQRLIPYGPLNWCLMYVDAWLGRAEIKVSDSSSAASGAAAKPCVRPASAPGRSTIS